MIKPCWQRDVPMTAPRPADVSLDSRLTFSWSYEPPPLTVQLAALQGQV
ncbi:MAG: hypothetical protein HC890_00885 [Chloroflexaceae bacterium]|nr:hypothetical protein [Chloroflexaceae bacterium]